MAGATCYRLSCSNKMIKREEAHTRHRQASKTVTEALLTHSEFIKTPNHYNGGAHVIGTQHEDFLAPCCTLTVALRMTSITASIRAREQVKTSNYGRLAQEAQTERVLPALPSLQGLAAANEILQLRKESSILSRSDMTSTLAKNGTHSTCFQSTRGPHYAAVFLLQRRAIGAAARYRLAL